MNIRRWGIAVLAAGLVGGGCGTDEELERRQDQARATQKAYAPIQAQIVELGKDVGEAVATPDKAEAATFEALEQRMTASQQAIAALPTPESEVPEREALAKALGTAAADLGAIADALKDKDQAAVTAGIAKLVKDSSPISERRTEYEGALRALIGSE